MPVQRPTPLELNFPFKGINEIPSNRQQPIGTTHDALNVRPFDSLEERLRGGQRGGSAKYFADAVNGSEAIQSLDAITYALDPASLDIDFDNPIFSDDFSSYADGLLKTLNAADWPHSLYNDRGITTADAELLPLQQVSAGGAVSVSNAADGLVSGASSGAFESAITKDLVLGSAYAVRVGILHLETAGFPVHEKNTTTILLRVDPSAKTCIYVKMEPDAADAATGTLFFFRQASNISRVAILGNIYGVDRQDFTLAGGLNWEDAVATFDVRVSGDTFSCYINDVLIESFTDTNFASDVKVGVALGKSDGGTVNDWDDTPTEGYIDSFDVYRSRTPTAFRSTKIVVASGGNIYAGTASGGLNLAGSGTGALSASAIPSGVGAYQKMYFVDGFVSGNRIYNPNTDVVSAWAASAGMLPAGGFGTTYSISAMSISSSTITATGATAAFAAGDVIQLVGHSVASNNQTYKVVTDNGGDELEVTPAPTSEVAEGSIREANYACQHAALYRGRIVLWGLASDPHNWFMSAAGNPLDFDYFPSTTTQTQAVAGNNSDAGLLGDALVACIPISDDLMLMGGDHTLWVMRGDPAAGGVIDNVSYQTGISGPDAFALDPSGTIYFFGSGTLWRMGAEISTPEPMSQGRLDKTFQDIDVAEHRVLLLWDSFRHGLHIYLTPSAQPSTAPIHYFWDQRTDSFWKDQYPAATGPTAVLLYDADDPNDKALLLGSWDSYIRYPDEGDDDDGTVIVSYCWFTPLAGGDYINTRVYDTRVILGSGSDSVTFEIHAASTLEVLNASSTPVVSRLMVAGRNVPLTQKVNGNAINFRLSNSAADQAAAAKTWALESISTFVGQTGKHRHGRL